MVSIGRDLPQEFLDAHRRRRLAGIVAELVHEQAGGDLTAGQIISRARVSRNTFYDLFASKDDCARFACGEAQRRIFDPVRASLEQAGSWPEQLSDAVGALLQTIVAEPAFADLCLVHSMALDGGGKGSCQEAGIATMVAALEGGRETGRAALAAAYREPPQETEELIAGGVLAVIAMRIRRGELASLPGLHGDLVTLAANPFVGAPLAESYGCRLRAA